MKPIPSENVLVRPFKTYKTHQYTYTYGESNPSGEVVVNEATSPPDHWIWSGSAEPINTGSIIYSRPLYKSLEQMFYPNISTRYPLLVQKVSGSNIYYDSGSWTYTATGSLRRPPRFDRIFSLPTGSSVYVVNVAQKVFGDKVYPSSFVITSPSSTASLYDNGDGRIVSSTDTSSIVGNIFYEFGIAVIQKMPSSSFTSSVVSNTGLYFTSGSDITVQYQSQHTIYEHVILCTMERGEFNFPTNPSLQIFTSSSISGSLKLFDSLQSGSLRPYFTTIGLFNSKGEMVAVAKTPRPIRRLIESDQTVVVKFDI